MTKKSGKKRVPLQVDEPSDDEFYVSTNDQEELMAETMDTPPEHRKSSVLDRILQAKKMTTPKVPSVETVTNSFEDEEHLTMGMSFMQSHVKIDKETREQIRHLNGDILKGVVLNDINHLASWKYDLVNAASIDANLKIYLFAALMEPEKIIRALQKRSLTKSSLTSANMSPHPS